MVKGLDLFGARFSEFTGEYTLIGGTAAELSMRDTGLDFRATKDLDIVLVAESLSPRFGEAFWQFVRDGGYEIRERGEVERRCFFRFKKPADPNYPAMLELFSRLPDALPAPADGTITPIPFGESVASLSAILLDDELYEFLLGGKVISDGLCWVRETHLIPLKATAWFNLKKLREQGDSIDADEVRKHLRDVFRLAQLLTEDMRIELPTRMRTHLSDCLAAAVEERLELKTFGVAGTLDAAVNALRMNYGL